MVKMVSDRKILPKKGCKIATQKKMFLGEFLLTEQDFFGIGFLTTFNGLFAHTSQSPMSKNFGFRNPCGKVMERRGLRFANFCS